jgi:hypothetical protein
MPSSTPSTAACASNDAGSDEASENVPWPLTQCARKKVVQNADHGPTRPYQDWFGGDSGPRSTGEWLHLDVGIYQALSAVLDGIKFPITVANRAGEEAIFTLCGLMCDSADTLWNGQKLPESITKGDPIVLDFAGAYTESTFTRFNGIEPPAIHFLDDLNL